MGVVHLEKWNVRIVAVDGGDTQRAPTIHELAAAIEQLGATMHVEQKQFFQEYVTIKYCRTK